MKRYRSNINKVLKFNSIAMQGTKFGSENILEEGHRRLVKLISNKVLLHPLNICFLSDLNTIESNAETYNKIYEELKNKRRYSSKYSNSVDAEHAALALEINNNLAGPDNVLNIFTGSPIPYSVYEHYPVITKRHNIDFYLAKCSIHIAARLFCENELEKANIDKLDFLDSGLEVLRDISSHGIKMDKLSKYQIYDKSVYYAYFFDTFIHNEKFGKYLYEAFKFGELYEFEPKTIREYQLEYDKNKLERIAKLANESDVFIRKDDLINNLEKTHENLYKYSKKSYGLLVNELKKNDISFISPKINEIYEKLMKEPLTPQELKDSLKRANNDRR